MSARGRGEAKPPMVELPLAEPASPRPEEVELMGLGAMVAVFSRMTAEERMQSLDYLSSRYGSRVPGLKDNPSRVEMEAGANDLADVIAGARLAEVRFGSYALARMILDAGYRKVEE